MSSQSARRRELSLFLDKFIPNKQFSANGIIAVSALTSIAFFAKGLGGTEHLPEIIGTYIAGGIGIESIGIMLDRFSQSSLDESTEQELNEHLLDDLERAYSNGDLENFGARLNEDIEDNNKLENELQFIFDQLNTLANVIGVCLQYHEESTVRRLLTGLSHYFDATTENIIQQLATRQQGDDILLELQRINEKLPETTLQISSNIANNANTTNTIIDFGRFKLNDEDKDLLKSILYDLSELRDTTRRENFLDNANLSIIVRRLDFQANTQNFVQQLIRETINAGLIKNTNQLAFKNLIVYTLNLVTGQKDREEFLRMLLGKLDNPNNFERLN